MKIIYHPAGLLSWIMEQGALGQSRMKGVLHPSDISGKLAFNMVAAG
jgi:hypothetical protein